MQASFDSRKLLPASIHDVSPRFESEIDPLADRFEDLLGAPRFAWRIGKLEHAAGGIFTHKRYSPGDVAEDQPMVVSAAGQADLLRARFAVGGPMTDDR